MTDDILLIDTDERVRTLTLNRPQSRNALSAALRDRFFAALADAEADDDIDVAGPHRRRSVFWRRLDLGERPGTALPDISPRWPAATKVGIACDHWARGHRGLNRAVVLIAREHACFAADTHARAAHLGTCACRKGRDRPGSGG